MRVRNNWTPSYIFLLRTPCFTFIFALNNFHAFPGAIFCHCLSESLIFFFILTQVEEIPDNFPFKISDEKGFNSITLTRTYQGENIEVLVSMPSLVTGDEPDRENEADEDRNEDDQEEETQKAPKSSIPLTVTISKGEEGPSLEFICTAYPDEILIDALSVMPSESGEDEMITYEGPDFK